jgi:hypothetical protein
MAQTRMFRDRVVSMEQTLEGGEKHLPLLTDICREAFPELEYREHALDHERDLFVMDLAGADGRRVRVAWTRMVLFDAERIPTLTAEPASDLRSKIVAFLRARKDRPEIVVTFRHLEEGWVDTPEPRREGRRRRRGGRGGKGHDRGGPEKRRQGSGAAPGGPSRRGGPAGQAPGGQRPAAPAQRPQPQTSAARQVPGEGAAGAAPGGRRRRRFRRRRRGRGGSGAGTAGPAGPPPEKP